MNIRPDLRPDGLRATLLDRLYAEVRGLSQKRPQGMHPQGDRLFTYCALARERIAEVTLPHPLVGIVLRGEKEAWIGGLSETFSPGTVFALPRGLPIDVVNIPSAREGVYESLIFEIASLPPGVAPLPGQRRPQRPNRLSLRLTPDLVEAIAHAATAVAGAAARESVKTLRLAEMLALMRDDPAARHIFRQSLSDELAWHIAARPDHGWTVEEAARAMGLGGSTLRRRLAEAGTSFRAVVTGARMETARRLVDNGAAAGAAAEAVGYASRSHFARRYREAFGSLPSARGTDPG
ncbi:MAG: helix-turn-helix domain-containing protein [Albidovulum sp.]